MRPLLAGAGRGETPHPSLRPLHRCGGRFVRKSLRMKLEAREVGLIAAALALIADQGSKLFMLYGADFVHMPPRGSVPVLPFFNLVMVWNPGISYGLFPASGRLGTWVLIGLSVAAIIVLSWLLWRTFWRGLGLCCGVFFLGGVGR